MTLWYLTSRRRPLVIQWYIRQRLEGEGREWEPYDLLLLTGTPLPVQRGGCPLPEGSGAAGPRWRSGPGTVSTGPDPTGPAPARSRGGRHGNGTGLPQKGPGPGGQTPTADQAETPGGTAVCRMERSGEPPRVRSSQLEEEDEGVKKEYKTKNNRKTDKGRAVRECLQTTFHAETFVRFV